MPSASLPTVPRSTVARWVSLLAVGYIAGSALLVRDYIVQRRPTPTSASQSTGANSESLAARQPLRAALH